MIRLHSAESAYILPQVMKFIFFPLQFAKTAVQRRWNNFRVHAPSGFCTGSVCALKVGRSEKKDPAHTQQQGHVVLQGRELIHVFIIYTVYIYICNIHEYMGFCINTCT